MDLQDAGVGDVGLKDCNVAALRGGAPIVESSDPTSLEIGQMTLILKCASNFPTTCIECTRRW
jgi:hypothetical protein